MIHRKKNRPALQRRDILTVSLVSFFGWGICLTLLHPVFSGSLLFSILHSCVLFKALF